jgi:hypothetical protein
MLGLIVDGTEGLRITPKGELAAGTVPFRPETIFAARERVQAVRRWRAPKKIGAATLSTVEKADEK